MNRRWVFTILTNNPDLAGAADAAGIDRIGLDLEVLGKAERQAELGTWISDHRMDDAARVFPRVLTMARFARINPMNAASQGEVDGLIAAGADVLMVPYFHALEAVERFAEVVNRRAATVALVETIGSVAIAEEIARRKLVDEVHFGLTDLGLQLKKTHVEILADEGFVEAVARVRATGVPFGIAGVARPDDASLRYHPGTFVRRIAGLGASRALIARSFLRKGDAISRLAQDIAALRTFLAEC